MSEPTKKQALVKLDALAVQIGYPDRWRDYSLLEISRDSYLGNVRRAATFELHRQLAMIGKPINRADWYITAPTVDANAYPLLNEIAFPAGVLQPPLFDPAQDDAVNYGAIGMVIGHEITHLFDNRGRQFDEIGRLRDWWTKADAEQYETRAQCFVSEYTQEIPELGRKTNGSLTEAEDIADNGGLRLALMALKSTYKKEGKSLNQKGPDGWTTLQRFFLADAFDWCETMRPEMVRTWVLTNGHSLPQFRTNNVLANFSEFREAFGCSLAKPMVRQNACRVW
jgi:putative endopeptidase